MYMDTEQFRSWQGVIETFPGAFDKQGDGLLNHGRLYVFRQHLAFRSQLPFGLSTSAVIPLTVRMPCAAPVQLTGPYCGMPCERLVSCSGHCAGGYLHECSCAG